MNPTFVTGIVWLIFAALAQARPHQYDHQPLPRTAEGISVASAALLGSVRSATTHVNRDLGFQGQLGKYVLLTYGDTMYSDGNYSDHWRGMTSDSVAFATHDPLVVFDTDLNENGYPRQFCPVIKHFGEDPAECALGITNVVEMEPGQGALICAIVTKCSNTFTGVLYFLLNHRPGGVNNLKGAGVATVSLDSDVYPPVPIVKRLGQWWWDGETEPWYGDVGAIRTNGYIYAYGHAKDNPWVYVARVDWSKATDLSAYEYWNGNTWQRERLHTKDLGEKESVFWQINQGQVIWSNYHKCYLFVYCGKFDALLVLNKTDLRLQITSGTAKYKRGVLRHPKALGRNRSTYIKALPSQRVAHATPPFLIRTTTIVGRHWSLHTRIIPIPYKLSR